MTPEATLTEGTDLYRRAVAFDYGDSERQELMRRVWGVTPWVVDCFTGGWSDHRQREMEIREWCTERFGPEAFVIGGQAGNWQRGSVTIHGWTWLGFATEAMMAEFLNAWPDPVEETSDEKA